MSATLQFIVVGVIVAFAAAYVLRAMWKTWFAKSQPGCGSGCGKCSTPETQPEANTNGRRSLPMA
jgi:hypothetical protein